MSKLLKDEVSVEKVEKLAFLIQQQHSAFNKSEFCNAVLNSDWSDLSLKQRVRHISQQMAGFIEGDYSKQLDVLLPVSVEFEGLFHFIFADFVEVFGLEDYDISIAALSVFTENSTSEFAIRVFINQQPEKTKQQLLNWSRSDNVHLRRLASEGVRPKLPWATHLNWIAENPEWVREIIENLLTDPEIYVQKSVANLINDLSKSQPLWVLTNSSKWLKQYPESKTTSWIIKHGLRSLLKQGDTTALQIIGYPTTEHICLEAWQLQKTVQLGDYLNWHFKLHSEQPLGKLRVEYALSFLRNKQKPYRKVFRLAESNYRVNSKEFQSRHNFKPITTRKYYAGVHKIELILNGSVIQTDEFELLTESI